MNKFARMARLGTIRYFMDVDTGANGGGATPPATPPVPPPAPDNTAPVPNGEIDLEKVINDAVNKAKEQWEEHLKKKESEAERYKKMTKEEKEKAVLEDKIKEYEGREAEYKLKDLRYEATKTLAEKKIPIEFVEFIVGRGMDAETVNKNITSFEKIYNKGRQDALKEAFGNNANPPKMDSNTKAITKEDFAKMNYTDRAKLYEENYELYKSLVR